MNFAKTMSNQKRNKQAGYTLLELLLVVTLSGLIVIGLLQFFDFYAKDAQNRQSVEHLLDAQVALEEYVSINFQQITTATIPAVGNVAAIPLAELTGNAFLPPNYNPRNPLRQDYVFVVRNAGASEKGVTVEALVIGVDQAAGVDERISVDRLVEVARLGGEQFGVVTDLALSPNCCAGNVQSLSGGWSVPLVDVAPLLTQTVPLGIQQGYLASYGRITQFSAINNDVLYRVFIEGSPQLNQMETDLSMDENNINNVNYMTVDYIDIPNGGTLEIDGVRDDGQRHDYALTVEETLRITGDLATDMSAGNSYKNINGTGFCFADSVTGTMRLQDAGGADLGAAGVADCQLNTGSLYLFEDRARLDVQGNMSGEAADTQLDMPQGYMAVTGDTLDVSHANFRQAEFRGSIVMDDQGGLPVNFLAQKILVNGAGDFDFDGVQAVNMSVTDSDTANPNAGGIDTLQVRDNLAAEYMSLSDIRLNVNNLTGATFDAVTGAVTNGNINVIDTDGTLEINGPNNFVINSGIEITERCREGGADCD